MERTSDFEQLLFLYKMEGKGLAKNINMRRELEAQETTSEPVQEYLDMDKITLVKMLLASQEENRKLHDKLDKLREEAKEREAKAEARNEELMNANRRQFEYQIKLMDQLTDMKRQLKQTHDQYTELLVELKRQKDLNKQSSKEK
jgi:hypothetical protein